MAKTEAQNALYDHIVESLEEVKTNCGSALRASAIKDLAMAYRLVSGGPQAGTSVVEK